MIDKQNIFYQSVKNDEIIVREIIVQQAVYYIIHISKKTIG